MANQNKTVAQLQVTQSIRLNHRTVLLIEGPDKSITRVTAADLACLAGSGEAKANFDAAEAEHNAAAEKAAAEKAAAEKVAAEKAAAEAKQPAPAEPTQNAGGEPPAA